MYLPVIIAPKNDETTASWIRRLTLANGFDNTEEFAQQFICDSDIANEQRFKAMLGTEDFISLYKALNLQGVSMWDLYMKTSCYGGIAPFLSDARQTHYLNTAFRLGVSNNSIVSASNSLTSELRFCPLCKKEDEVAGGWYYHRAHQMPSIKVCYKHGSILRRFTGKFGTELSASPQSVSCTNTENSWEQDFAVFAKELLDAAPDISAENTKAAVLREVKCQGFYAPASEYAKLNTALKNAGVYVSSLSRLFVQMYVFDFALDRALKQIADYSCRLNVNESNPEKKVGEFINFLPVLAYDGSTMKAINAVDVLDIAMAGTSATLLARKWESALLVNVDNETLERLINNEEAMKALMSIEGFRALNQDIQTIINKSESVKKAKQENKDLTQKQKKQLTEDEKEYKSKRKQIQEKLIKFATRIPIFMYLTDYREHSLKDIITQLEPGLFKKVTGLNVKDFELLVSLNVFIDQLVGLCMYLNLDYISSKSRPTIDADYINKVAKRHYRGIQKLMDELDDPLNEKKRQKIIEEADRKLDNLLQEHKQTAFAEKIMESAEADEKKIPLKKNIIHNIEMVVADYTSDRIAAAVDRVLISTDETDEKVLTRVVMKLLTDSEKETPTKKKKSKKKPLQTSDMVKFIIE